MDKQSEHSVWKDIFDKVNEWIRLADLKCYK